jgi:hypothetical protein
MRRFPIVQEANYIRLSCFTISLPGWLVAESRPKLAGPS